MKKFTIKVVKPQARLVQTVLDRNPHLTKAQVMDMMKYNIIPSSYLSEMTGKRPEAIMTMSKVELRDGVEYSRLTRVAPFKPIKKGENTKLIFIEFDAKCKEFIKECCNS